MSSKKKSISSAINEIVSATPKDFASDDEAEETQAKVVEFDDEDGENDGFTSKRSSIRLKNNTLLEETDKRYKVKRVSGKKIFNQDESSDEDDDDDDDDNDDTFEGSEQSGNDDDNSLKGVSSNDEEGPNSDGGNEDEESSGESLAQDNDDDDDDEEEDYDDDSDNEIDQSNPLRRERDLDQGIRTMSETNPRAEIEKGNCVREQLRLWENLLEMRIKMQKCLVNSNKMPQYDAYKTYEADGDFKKQSKVVRNKLGKVLSSLLQLQSNLLDNFPETKDLLKHKGKASDENDADSSLDDEGMDEEIPSESDSELNEDEEVDGEKDSDQDNSSNGPPKKKMKLMEFEKMIAKNHKSYVDYRNSVIQKWNDKTRIAAGIISKGINQPAVKQIEFALANKDKLIRKTQLKRSEYEIMGKESKSVDENDGRRVQEYDEEIYDDDDFYHQLLRELIEYKSADVTDPIQLSKQWIQLQNMRSKMKRKIDTRATKGRRIRYNVHQKLVNFMAPITINDTWTDHAKNELFSSLFGKIKSSNKETTAAT